MLTDDLQYLHENETHSFYRSFFQNHVIIWSQDKLNPGEILVSADSVAAIFGFKTFQEMMKNDQLLDLMSEFMKSTGTCPIKNEPW